MPTQILLSPRKLESTDIKSDFHSGANELDTWLQKYAKQNLEANNAVTYVTTTDDGKIVGYYAICSAGISKDHVPESFGKKRPRDIPCILLARLAIDTSFQGKGIGRHLFRDAIIRAVSASESIGASCLLIHARDQEAKDFYTKQVDLLESPIDKLHLILPMSRARRAIIESSSQQSTTSNP